MAGHSVEAAVGWGNGGSAAVSATMVPLTKHWQLSGALCSPSQKMEASRFYFPLGSSGWVTHRAPCWERMRGWGHGLRWGWADREWPLLLPVLLPFSPQRLLCKDSKGPEEKKGGGFPLPPAFGDKTYLGCYKISFLSTCIKPVSGRKQKGFCIIKGPWSNLNKQVLKEKCFSLITITLSKRSFLG